MGVRTGGAGGSRTGDGAGGLGTDGVGTVGVGSDGVDTVGVGWDGTETVGVGTGKLGTDTVVGTVKAGAECGGTPSRSNARATIRIPQTAALKASRGARMGRLMSRARDPLQTPRMLGCSYPFVTISIHTQMDSISDTRLS